MMETPARPEQLMYDPRFTQPRTPKVGVGWQIATAVLALALVVAGVVAVVQIATLADTRDDLAAVEARSETLEGNIASLETENEATQAHLDDEVAQTREQANQLAYCDTALGVGVQMDGVLHKLVDNALTFGSLAQWNALWDRYDRLGERWALIASDCTGNSGDYTFS